MHRSTVSNDLSEKSDPVSEVNLVRIYPFQYNIKINDIGMREPQLNFYVIQLSQAYKRQIVKLI